MSKISGCMAVAACGVCRWNTAPLKNFLYGGKQGAGGRVIKYLTFNFHQGSCWWKQNIWIRFSARRKRARQRKREGKTFSLAVVVTHIEGGAVLNTTRFSYAWWKNALILHKSEAGSVCEKDCFAQYRIVWGIFNKRQQISTFGKAAYCIANFFLYFF